MPSNSDQTPPSTTDLLTDEQVREIQQRCTTAFELIGPLALRIPVSVPDEIYEINKSIRDIPALLADRARLVAELQRCSRIQQRLTAEVSRLVAERDAPTSKSNVYT